MSDQQKQPAKGKEEDKKVASAAAEQDEAKEISVLDDSDIVLMKSYVGCFIRLRATCGLVCVCVCVCQSVWVSVRAILLLISGGGGRPIV